VSDGAHGDQHESQNGFLVEGAWIYRLPARIGRAQKHLRNAADLSPGITPAVNAEAARSVYALYCPPGVCAQKSHSLKRAMTRAQR